MSSIHFTTQELLTDFKHLAQEASQLQKTVASNRFCRGYGAERDFSELKAFLKEKEALREAAKASGDLSPKMDLQMGEAAAKAAASFASIQETFDRLNKSWTQAISQKAYSIASPLSAPLSNVYRRYQNWMHPKLNRDQIALVEQFIQTKESNWELNRKIVRDKAVVQELIDRKVFLRRPGDQGQTLLDALALVYDPLEEFYYGMAQTNKKWLRHPVFRNGSNQMKAKLEILSLLLKSHKWTLSDAFYFYERCLIRDCGLFLDLLKKIPRVELTPEEQVRLWLAVKSDRGAQFLKEIGCDPNIRHEGRTPLLEMAHRKFSYPLSAAELAKILIAAGANPKATANVLGFEMSAVDMTDDPYLKAVLQSPIEQKEEKKAIPAGPKKNFF